MPLNAVSPLLRQFVEDELLRAPLLFDQLLDAVLADMPRGFKDLNPVQRTAMGDLLQAVRAQRANMGEYFLRSLREQIDADLRQQPAKAAARPDAFKNLALVDEDEVAVDVEISRTTNTVKNVAEYELRELQAFISALVGDADVAREHNPFRAETLARAVWASTQALSVSRAHHMAFMRQATAPLAQLLRTSYAASTSRLESMGVEPAGYRTVILPSGSRRGGRTVETTFTPDLYRMSETMPEASDARQGLSYQGQFSSQAEQAREGGRHGDAARQTAQRDERQAVELVSRLFEAMKADKRVPQDVGALIGRLQDPAKRLVLRDRSVLDHNKHPLWRFINQLVFSAEMSPDGFDPERVQLLRLGQATIEQLNNEPAQTAGLYRWAVERLEAFLQKRLTRRLTAVASQVGALQKLEDKLAYGQPPPSTMSGPLDFHQLDTVPAAFMETAMPAQGTSPASAEWIKALRPGDWVRMFHQGRWRHAQLLWPGERREFMLFGDGASDETWAVRSGALLMMHGNGLAKTLKQRSIVGTAAAKVQEQLGTAAAPAA